MIFHIESIEPLEHRCETCGHVSTDREVRRARELGVRWPNEQACDRLCNYEAKHARSRRP